MSILANFLGGQQAGQQQRAYAKEQSKLAQMEALAPQVVAGDAGAYAKAAALDPKAAQGYQAAGDAQFKRLGGFIDYVEGARKTGNPLAVNAALAQGANFIQQLTGKPGPTEWSDDMEPGWEALKAQVAMARGGQNGTIQSQKISDDGYIINTYRDGRMEKTGQKVDRQMWLRDHPGMAAPELVGKDGSLQVVGQAAQGSPQPVGPQRVDMEADIELANQMIAAGIPEAQVDAFLTQRGQRAPAGAAQVTAAPAQAFARPSAAQDAAATERAKLQAQLDYLPQQQAIETQGAIDRAVGTDRGKAQVEREAAAPGAISTLQASLKSIDELLASPELGSIVGLNSINPLNRIPGSNARGLIARSDQIAGQAFLAAFNQLKGGGAITEREGAAATAAMARLDRSQNLEDYKKALNDLRGAIAPAISRQQAALGGQQQGGGQQGAAIRIQSADDYNRLPSGAIYIAPDGMQRRKR